MEKKTKQTTTFVHGSGQCMDDEEKSEKKCQKFQTTKNAATAQNKKERKFVIRRDAQCHDACQIVVVVVFV